MFCLYSTARNRSGFTSRHHFGYSEALAKNVVARRAAISRQLTTTALARTGLAVNVLLPSSYISPYGNSGTLRPNLVPGVSLTPAAGRTIAHWINPAAFTAPSPGTFGNAPRNLFRGPGTWQVDGGVAKTFPLTEHARVELRSAFYNVFNHSQLGQPQATFNPSNTAGFGSIINTGNLNTAIVSPITPVGSGTPREIQFGCGWSSNAEFTDFQ